MTTIGRLTRQTSRQLTSIRSSAQDFRRPLISNRRVARHLTLRAIEKPHHEPGDRHHETHDNTKHCVFFVCLQSRLAE